VPTRGQVNIHLWPLLHIKWRPQIACRYLWCLLAANGSIRICLVISFVEKHSYCLTTSFVGKWFSCFRTSCVAKHNHFLTCFVGKRSCFWICLLRRTIISDRFCWEA
jgi:hypothetical protein